MKKCNACNKIFEGDSNTCPYCGTYPVSEVNTVNTPNIIYPKCKASISGESAAYCSNCGYNLNSQNNLKNVFNRVTENEFVHSVKQDLSNSQSINMVKDRVKSTSAKVKTADIDEKKKLKIIGIAAAIVIVVLLIVTNIHQCEECDKVYLGKEYEINYWGQSETVCKNCHNDFYGYYN